MRIVVTGGNGYLGARLSSYFADLGHEVIPVCFPKIPENQNWTNKMFSIIAGDLRDTSILEKIDQFKADVLIHLVSLDHFESEKEPKFVNEINVLPTWQLLERCTNSGLKKFIYFSSVQVYGKIPFSIIDEMHQVAPVNTYGLTHLMSEQICDLYNRKTNTNVISVRLSNSYGDPIFPENNCWWLAINDLCKNAYLEKEIRLLSDGTPQRDFIHGNDICGAVRTLIQCEKKEEYNVYHISSGKTFTLLELAQIIKLEFNIRYHQSIPIFVREGSYKENPTKIEELEKFTISNQKLNSLGFSTSYTIQKGVNELFDYLEKSDKIF